MLFAWMMAWLIRLLHIFDLFFFIVGTLDIFQGITFIEIILIAQAEHFKAGSSIREIGGLCYIIDRFYLKGDCLELNGLVLFVVLCLFLRVFNLVI